METKELMIGDKVMVKVLSQIPEPMYSTLGQLMIIQEIYKSSQSHFSMTKRKYCYEYTEYRQYKCCECGRTMHEPTSHYCNGQYRKYNLKFKKYETI